MPAYGICSTFVPLHRLLGDICASWVHTPIFVLLYDLQGSLLFSYCLDCMKLMRPLLHASPSIRGLCLFVSFSMFACSFHYTFFLWKLKKFSRRARRSHEQRLAIVCHPGRIVWRPLFPLLGCRHPPNISEPTPPCMRCKYFSSRFFTRRRASPRRVISTYVILTG
jgi:hypothetical protein